MTKEKLFVLEKLKFLLLKEFQFIKSLKIWWSMADMLHQMFDDIILSTMLLHQ